MTFVVAELVDESLLVEREAVVGATGRRPVPVDINYEAHLAIGFKLHLRKIDCDDLKLRTAQTASPAGTANMPIRLPYGHDKK